MANLKILIADDHAIVRHGLSALLATEPDFQLVGAAADGKEALAMSEEFQPDVLVLDLAMPHLGGVDVMKRLKRVSPGTRVLVLTTCSDEHTVIEALQAGAAGYLTKRNGSQELVSSLRAIRNGVCISPEILRELKLAGFDPLNPNQPSKPIRELSTREAQVLQAIADGLPNKAIAAKLGISIKTVEKHRQRLMDKLNLHETAGLTRYAIAHKVVELECNSTRSA
jgi:DNA-binding NarL/FixJ family response regulator